ncbi:MAG: hypothetical protein HY595_06125 [Candidatus Omnitrophica bacterium]|nr:hypothetical protein [Candidatus Omnitrophota bacterium]
MSLVILVGALTAAEGAIHADPAREPMDTRGQAVALARECEELLSEVPPPPFSYRKVSELMSSTFSADPYDPDPLRGQPMHCRRTYLYDPDPSFKAMEVPYQFHLVVFNRFDGRLITWYTERLSAWMPLYTTYEGHDLEAGWDSGYGGQVIAALYRLRTTRRPEEIAVLRITPDASDLDLEVAIATPEMPHADEFFSDQFSPHPKTGEHALAWMRARGLIESMGGRPSLTLDGEAGNNQGPSTQPR